ncbi:DUF2599 domain-containing protein [Williamsia sp. MIQD14]|uniref:DUF2599 domain-containing protein n=1 Tax=Williamsia sp. MIQD14 TaxID=3425703 RepID=UPI003DA0E0FA
MSTRRRYAACTLVLGVAMAAAACSTGSDTDVAASSSTPPSSTAPEVITASQAPAVPPFIDRVQVVTLPSGTSVQVYPTASGRAAQGAGDNAVAWAEVLADDPGADTPGMRAQFDCHWTFARIVAPDKPSWNLEPWRPVVSAQQMIDDRCNPGGAEE